MSKKLDYNLIVAASTGNLEDVKQLLDQGANVGADDESPLICACHKGHLHVVKYLVEHGANIYVNMTRYNAAFKPIWSLEKNQPIIFDYIKSAIRKEKIRCVLS